MRGLARRLLPVKVGLLVPKSGVYAPLGRDMENGFRMYLDAKGGKLGGRTVELVVADEGGGPDTGVAAAQKLLQQDRVTTLVGIANSAVALGVRGPVTAFAVADEFAVMRKGEIAHRSPPSSSATTPPWRRGCSGLTGFGEEGSA